MRACKVRLSRGRDFATTLFSLRLPATDTVPAFFWLLATADLRAPAVRPSPLSHPAACPTLSPPPILRYIHPQDHGFFLMWVTVGAASSARLGLVLRSRTPTSTTFRPFLAHFPAPYHPHTRRMICPFAHAHRMLAGAKSDVTPDSTPMLHAVRTEISRCPTRTWSKRGTRPGTSRSTHSA